MATTCHCGKKTYHVPAKKSGTRKVNATKVKAGGSAKNAGSKAKQASNKASALSKKLSAQATAAAKKHPCKCTYDK